MSEFKNMVPENKEPVLNTYKCNINALNIQNYRVLIDQDIIDDKIYLELGYDQNKEYDTAFYFDPKDALQIAENLLQAVEYVNASKGLLLESKQFVNIMEKRLKNHEIVTVNINPISLYTEDICDILFGRLIIEVSYIDTSNITTGIILLSDTFKISGVDMFVKNVTSALNKYGVTDININEAALFFIIEKMRLLFRKQIDTNKLKVEYAKPKEFTDAEQYAREIMKKINNK